MCFIIGAEPADHGGIAMEPTSDLNGLHVAPIARQVRKLRPRLCPGPLATCRGEMFGFTTVNLSECVQQFFK